MSELKNQIQKVLDKTFFNQSKRKINIENDYINFSCPYCLDSQKNPNKKRAYIYLNSLFFVCFHCGIKRPFHIFLSDFEEPITNLKLIRQIEERISKNILANASFNGEILSYLKDYAINRKDFENMQCLVRCDENDKFLKSRFIENLFRHFSTIGDIKYIFNTIGDSFIGFQVRNPHSDIKYKSYTLSRIYQKYYSEDKKNELSIIDKYSLLFNFFNINFNDTIYLFEGPIDSFLLDNSVALCGVNKKLNYFDNIENVKILFDNDDAGKTKMIELLKSGRSVFMWKKILKDYNIKTPIKDLNDLHIYAKNHKLNILDNLSEYFTKKKLDILHV